MARPSQEVIHSIDVGDGTTWEILKAERYYAITYKDEPIGIRIQRPSLSGQGYLYKKMTYTTLGSARAQAVRLNHRFKCADFQVMMIG